MVGSKVGGCLPKSHTPYINHAIAINHSISTISILLQVGEWLVVRLVVACPNLTNLSLGMHTSLTDGGLRKILASNR